MPAAKKKHVIIYTDGACRGNPGPGGYGAVLLYSGHRKELSGGFRLTTNNRMEMLAAIVALKALKNPCSVTIFSDSQYLVKAINQRWPQKWQAAGWKKADKKPALNVDLWQELLQLSQVHDLTLQWIKGHAGDPENERCDELSVKASHLPHLPPDPGYEARRRA